MGHSKWINDMVIDENDRWCKEFLHVGKNIYNYFLRFNDILLSLKMEYPRLQILSYLYLISFYKYIRNNFIYFEKEKITS